MQQQVQEPQLAKSSKQKKKDDWIWWAIGGTTVGLVALGVGVFVFGNKEPGPVNPPAIGAQDLPYTEQQNPFVSLNPFMGPNEEFQRMRTSNQAQATKKPCGCSAAARARK